MSAIEVWPAIDLLQGAPTRLYQGSFDHPTAYARTASYLLAYLREIGCPRLHLVDLTGAQSGQFSAWDTLAAAAHLGFLVEVGGGFRDFEAIARALAEGAGHVVLGTKLITSRSFAEEVLTRFGPERIVVGLDVLDHRARIHGWTEPGPDAKASWQSLRRLGYDRLNVTDIQRDGSLAGIRPDFWQAWGTLPGNLCAGGGVGSLKDLEMLAQCHLSRAVVGKAWLEGIIDLTTIDWEEP